jgi:hypothetical protein
MDSIKNYLINNTEDFINEQEKILIKNEFHPFNDILEEKQNRNSNNTHILSQM